MNRKYRQLQTNDRAGRLLVIDQGPRTRRHGFPLLCLCDCGRSCVFMSVDLSRRFTLGINISCGCWLSETRSQWASENKTTHGLRSSSEYTVWANMKNRTSNPKCKEYPYYGGRGIKVCPEWIESFEQFYKDMGPRPSLKHSIDRYPNNNGNYEMGNVRWATRSEQMLNRRSRTVTINGQVYPIREIAELAGTSISTVHRRLGCGLNDERLFNHSRSHRSNSRNAAQSKSESTTTNTNAKGA